MFVYLATNKINGKRYVGQHSGINLTSYWRHKVCKALRNRPEDRCVLYKAIRKYGPNSFEVKPSIIVGTKQDMGYYESKLIEIWDLRNLEKGYNLASGGRTSLGTKFSKETRALMSEIQKGNTNRRGKKASKETRLKISISGLGRKHNEATRIQMSESQRLRRLREAQNNG